MEKIFSTEVIATGGREGHVKSSDGVIDLDVRKPVELGGKGEGYTNPEQLFAAGYSACFDGALNFIALSQGKKLKDTQVAVTVHFGKTEDGGFGIAADIKVHIPNVEKEIAEKLVTEAHNFCPYSKATRGNIEVNLSLSDNPL